MLLLFYYVITTDPEALDKMSKATLSAMDANGDVEKGEKSEKEPLVNTGAGSGEYKASTDLD